MTSTIQIPNITINGDDYWINHTSQYNAMIGESISPLTIDLKGYPTSNTISIVDPTDEYYFVNNDYEIFDEDTLNKSSSVTVKIGKMPEFWEVPYEIDSNGVYSYPTSSFTLTLPSDIHTIGNYGLNYCFDNCNTLTTVNMSNVNIIGDYGLQYCFSNCSTLSNVNMNNLTNVKQYGLYYCFYSCSSLTTAPTFANLTTVEDDGLTHCFHQCTSLTTAPTFDSLTTINGYYGLSQCFYNCTSLTTPPTFANLTTIGSYGLSNCFSGCTSLTTAPTFASLTTIGQYGLSGCFYYTKITSLSFPSLTSNSFGTYTNQFNNMLSGVDGCTVHFPSNLQSVIGSWSDVTDGFGGTNTTVLFDLPATT